MKKKLGRFTKNTTWKLVDDSLKYGRITARIPDLGRQEVKKLNQRIRGWIDQEIDTSRLALQFVGFDLLIDHMHEHRVNNMAWGLLLAIVAVALLIGMLFRQFALVAITVIANAIPLLLVAGLMGFLV